MSKRFGRNQRRAMREALNERRDAVARLSLELQWSRRDVTDARDRIASLTRKLNMMSTQIAAANEILGPTIVLPPVEEIVSPAAFRDMTRYEVIRMTEISRASDFYGQSLVPHTASQALETVRQHTLDLIEGGLELRSEHPLDRVPHAYVRTVAGDFLYRVPLRDLAQINHEEGVNRIAYLLARTFIDEVKRHFGRR